MARNCSSLTATEVPSPAWRSAATASCSSRAASDKTLRFWNPANGQSLGVVGAHPAAVRGLAISPNNNAVYSAGADGSLKFWTLPPVASKTAGRGARRRRDGPRPVQRRQFARLRQRR